MRARVVTGAVRGSSAMPAGGARSFLVAAGNHGDGGSVDDDVMVAAGEFETLFRAVYPRLVSFGVIKTGRVDVARDLAQEAMLRAHARWDEVRECQSPQAWCHVVMGNLVIDHYRSAGSEQRAIERLSERRVDGTPTPTLDRWNELVEPLSDRQRLILTLYYAEDQSVTEIADSLGTSSGAVKASLFKARRTLRRRFEREERHG